MIDDYVARGDEIVRLHEFTLRLAQRLFLAAEVLAMRAERKKAEAKAPAVVWVDGGVVPVTDTGR